MRRKRAIVTTTVPVTIDKFMGEYVDQLEAGDHQTVVVTSPGSELATLARRHPRAEVVALPMAREVTPLRDLVALIAWVRRLRASRPDVIVAMTPKAALLSMMAGRVVGTRRRLYLSGGLRLESEAGLRRSVLTLTEKLTVACATEVVVNSRSLRDVYEELGLAPSRKLRVTSPGSSHGVDAAHFDESVVPPVAKGDMGLQDGLLTITFIGRLTRDKGIEELALASEILTARDVAHQLLVVGPLDEPDAPSLVERLERLPARVILTGAVVDTRPYLRVTDVHVLPSRREGFPNVVLEAASMTVPSVVSDATGCVDSVLDRKTGLIFPVGDATALADAIEALASDADRQSLGRSGRDWVVSAFEPRAIVADVLRLQPRSDES
ncbi:glycosyltransferase [Nocardioides xinjiangensis]|uniref:glycosyltransferase n=1 Tax=Nocardioides xinjiangensis TaxID=2817376 RepID=UPI001B30FB41|nr:glycosyltransferase [Nocardioides sp. SYSU D00778]